MKPPNILIDINGKCKITDFGLARYYGQPDREMTRGVATRWYKPPEIIYGAAFYGEAIDIWACGCILSELFLRQPIFKGDGDIDQLSKIFAVRGTPNVDPFLSQDSNWPDANLLPNYFEFEHQDSIPMKALIPSASDEALELIDSLLQLNPVNRLKIDDALNHPFFSRPYQKTERSYLKRLAELDIIAKIEREKN